MDQQYSGKGAHDKDKQVDLKTSGSLTQETLQKTAFLNHGASVPRPSVN